MDKSREEWFEYFEFDRGEEGIWKSAREDRFPFVSILPSPFKDSYPQSGLRLCIFDPVRIEIWPDFLTILRSTCLTDWIAIITLRKVDERFIQVGI